MGGALGRSDIVVKVPRHFTEWTVNVPPILPVGRFCQRLSAFQERYEHVKGALMPFLRTSGFRESQVQWLPAVGPLGQNLTQPPTERALAAWWRGPTVLQAIDAFRAGPRALDRPLRLPIIDVFKGPRGAAAVGGKLEGGALKARSCLPAHCLLYWSYETLIDMESQVLLVLLWQRGHPHVHGTTYGLSYPMQTDYCWHERLEFLPLCRWEQRLWCSREIFKAQCALLKQMENP
jgi:hypothetical protein